MPWTPQDAPKYTHYADSENKKITWAKVANNVLEKTGNKARALREANATIRPRHQDII